MPATCDFRRKGLPRAIPAEKLQVMIGPSAAFCSRKASNSTLCDLLTRWPFLFSRPLMGADKKPAQ